MRQVVDAVVFRRDPVAAKIMVLLLADVYLSQDAPCWDPLLGLWYEMAQSTAVATRRLLFEIIFNLSEYLQEHATSPEKNGALCCRCFAQKSFCSCATGGGPQLPFKWTSF